MSWEVILPFLRPIEPALRDPDVSDILVNGSEHVFVERNGVLEELAGVHLTEKSLQVAVRNIARVLGDEVSPEKPLLDARLPDGSRVAAVLFPSAVMGTVLAIRKFHGRRYTAAEFVRQGTLTPETLDRLRSAIESRQTILVSGGTGAGKTTLVSALAAFIRPDERIVVIEDTSEIQLAARHLVRLEARRDHPGLPAVTVRDLLRETLRLRPDRILLGEVRGGEAFDLLQALNTGHAGSLSTVHANSAPQALARLTTCVLQAGMDWPYRAIRSSIAEVINIVVHLERVQGQRVVAQVLVVQGYDPSQDRYEWESVYERS